jgi:hypothetical protein
VEAWMLQHLVSMVDGEVSERQQLLLISSVKHNRYSCQFYTDGQTKEIKNIGTFTDGYAIQKFRNVTVNGVQGSDKAGISLTLTSNFPFLDAYLMYAECFVRGAGGNGQH